jgi:hypothetical protein
LAKLLCLFAQENLTLQVLSGITLAEVFNDSPQKIFLGSKSGPESWPPAPRPKNNITLKFLSRVIRTKSSKHHQSITYTKLRLPMFFFASPHMPF